MPEIFQTPEALTATPSPEMRDPKYLNGPKRKFKEWLWCAGFPSEGIKARVD